MTKPSEVAVIVPCYNEATVIAQTLKGVLKHYPRTICINDGSRDASSEEIKKTDAILVEHPINMGQGAALQTGIDFALQFPEVKYFVTFDADGQHDIADVKTMLKTIEEKKVDIVLGSRFLGETKNMSRSKKTLLKLAIGFTNAFSNVKLTDTHNGLRVFNRDFAQNLQITMPDMAHASEIIDRIGTSKWRYTEVPITITYTDYSKAKGQSIFNSVNILLDLLISRVGQR